MLELTQLRFRSIGRFVEEQSVDFTSFSPFAQIDGKNNNTGGSSGSGKSTVFMALDYLLGVNKRPATVLQSRYTEDALWVQGTFSKDDKVYIITRSKGLIKVHEYDTELRGSQAEEAIDKLLGMPRELFRKIIHKRQKEGGFFLGFTPKEMHDFLIDCIGLSTFKKKYEILEKELKRLEQNLMNQEADLMTNSSWLSATQEAILSLGLAPVQNMHKEVILELKEKYDRSVLRLTDVQKRCDKEYIEFSKNRPSINSSRPNDSNREVLEKRREEVEAKISACLDKERERQQSVKKKISDKSIERSKLDTRLYSGGKAKADATRIAAEIKSIRSQTCPTCSQSWANESSASVEQRKLEELTKLKVIIADGLKAEIDKDILEKELDELKPLLNPVYDPILPDLNEQLAEVCGEILEEKEKAGELYEQQTAETKKLLDEFSNKTHELQTKHQLEIEQVRGQVELDRRVFDLAVQKLKSYEEAKLRFDKTFSELDSKQKSLIEKITKCRFELESLALEQKRAAESLKAAKTYVSFSFDQALDEISDKATKIIRCIPNMSNATIQFEGTKESKDCRVKEEVNAVISVDGEPSVPIKSLSGGEESAMDLAVDLAVIDYIETRSGMGMNLFILDEPFNGLGTIEIEMALEVLKNSNTNKKLIIVDHNPEVKQMVQSRVVIERTGLTSKVT